MALGQGGFSSASNVSLKRYFCELDVGDSPTSQSASPSRTPSPSMSAPPVLLPPGVGHLGVSMFAAGSSAVSELEDSVVLVVRPWVTPPPSLPPHSSLPRLQLRVACRLNDTTEALLLVEAGAVPAGRYGTSSVCGVR